MGGFGGGNAVVGWLSMRDDLVFFGGGGAPCIERYPANDKNG